MILKKIEIQGFKSFPDRTEIVFSPGVIAVVGPNGSGKSNISDAILWALGEQNVRTLRGQKYQDVIFAGTDKRRPVGMAEVSLVVDNSSGKLPLAYSEVTVTRRAYRSGEGEFFINKTPCRLKDIYELFLDSGVGREAYSIVSQGEIDAILSARSEDRRALFDEAAGIKKYRHRKKEAVRKLEQTETNLLRVNDIIGEIQGQIDPMAEQAEVAKRYLELVARLREIEVGILVNDLHRFTAEIGDVRDEKGRSRSAIEDDDALLAALEEEKSALAVDLANADAQVERHQAMHQDGRTHAERMESRLALVKQRHTAAEKAETLLTQEIVQLDARIAQIEQQRVYLCAERDRVDGEENELTTYLAEQTAELESLQERMEEASRKVDDHKASYIELAKQLAAQRNELVNNASSIETLRALVNRRSMELRDAERAATRAATERDKVAEELQRIKAGAEAIAREMGKLRSKAEERQNLLAQIAEDSDQLDRSLVEKQSRLRTLREMEEAREGYFLGVRSVMSAAKAGNLAGSFAVVADVIKVPSGYETAFEVALGASLQDIIADSEREAKAGIKLLKRNKGGRATFLPLNLMRHTVSPLLKELVGKNGVFGLGNELVKCNQKYRPAVDALLAKVVVVQDVDSAVAVSKSAIGWSKIVTLDGELIRPSGAITGGISPGKAIHLLGRKREINRLQSEVGGLESRLATAEKRLHSVRKECDELGAKCTSLEDEDAKLKMSVLETERRLDFGGKESQRLTREFEALEAERDDIQENLRKAREAESALRSAVESADKENVTLDEVMAQADQEVHKLQEEYDSVGAAISRANVSRAGLTQRKLAVEQNQQTLEESARELSADLYRKKDQLENAVEEKAASDKEQSELEAALAKACSVREDTQAESDHWRKIKQSALNSSMEVSDRMREVSRSREELTQKVHACELREARLEVQIAQATARLLEEYDVTAEDALRRERPDVQRGWATEVLRLRREIRSMGDVNTGAVQEYSRLKERFEFLDAQRQDLVAAKEKLLDAIREIDESTRGIFVETFEAVGRAFDKMFQRLFGGGKTELVLTDPDDILETGIDVIVELPGKKRQNLQLLSGGERALTAGALMFALLFVRPSPFCVLDEVDAALDEANVERFTEIVKEFAEKSQMVVITHNRGTMEAADVLYGVTMEEPGVSKIVSLKLSDITEQS